MLSPGQFGNVKAQVGFASSGTSVKRTNTSSSGHLTEGPSRMTAESKGKHAAGGTSGKMGFQKAYSGKHRTSWSVM
jgi:hypothetical protein